MTTSVQRRRGTSAQHSTFTGLEGEITIDTTKDTAVIHDGSTVGGFPLAKENLANVNPTSLTALTGAGSASDDLFLVYDVSTSTLKKMTRAELNDALEQDALANITITGGSINGTTIGGSTPSTGAFTTLSSNSTTTLNGTTIPASKTLLVSTDIGVSVQGYDADLAAFALKTAPTGDVVGTSDTQTLTNKTINLTSNTLTGTIAQFNTALSDADFATLAGSESLSNKTITSSSLNSTPIGASSASTGAFTTLSASSTVSGSGFTTLFASPPAIGGTAAAAGSFTTLSASSTATLNTLSSSGATITGGSINGTAIGGSTAAAGTFTSLSDSGNLTFTGTGNRIIGDFNNGTIANRVMFQGSVVNAATIVSAIPNGTSQTTQLVAINGSDPTNAQFGQLLISASEVRLASSAYGTGTSGYLPLTMYTGGSERLRIDTSGNVGIGTTSPNGRLDVTASIATASITSSSTTAGNQPTLRFQHSGNNTFQIKGGTDLQLLSDDGANERMRITNAGNVGIGTSSPSSRLDVSGVISLQGTTLPSAGTARIFSRTSDSSFYLQSATSGSINLLDGSQNTMSVFGSSTVQFMTGNTERMRITSAGDVGIGTSSPSGVGIKLQVASVATNAGSTIAVSNSNSSQFLVSYGGHSADPQAIWFSNALRFGTATGIDATGFTELMRITSGGSLLFGTTDSIANITSSSGTGLALYNSSGNTQFLGSNANDNVIQANRQGTDGVIIALRKNGTSVGTINVTSTGTTYTGTNGITFTATQTASADANTLDDYEEGTWTPQLLSDGGSATGKTYATQVGKYTKIGNVVYFSFFVEFSNKGSNNINEANLAGLPFTVSASSGAGGGYVQQWANVGTNSIWFSYVFKNQTTAAYLSTVTAAATGTSYYLSTSYQNNTFFRGSGFYYVD